MRSYFSDQVSNILTEYFMHSSTCPMNFTAASGSTGTQIQIESETDEE